MSVFTQLVSISVFEEQRVIIRFRQLNPVTLHSLDSHMVRRGEKPTDGQ